MANVAGPVWQTRTTSPRPTPNPASPVIPSPSGPMHSDRPGPTWPVGPPCASCRQSPSQEGTTRATAADPPPSHREDGARAAALPSSTEQVASDCMRSLPCPRSSLLRPQQLPQDELFCVIEAQRRSSARLGPLDHHLAGSADSDQPAPAPGRRNSGDLGLGRPALVRVVASPGFAESLR